MQLPLVLLRGKLVSTLEHNEVSEANVAAQVDKAMQLVQRPSNTQVLTSVRKAYAAVAGSNGSASLTRLAPNENNYEKYMSLGKKMGYSEVCAHRSESFREFKIAIS